MTGQVEDVEQPPSYDRRAEVEALLAQDESIVGRVWLLEREGLPPREVAEQMGWATTGAVSNAKYQVMVLRDGYINDSPSMALQSARKVRAWLKSKPLSAQLRADLTAQEELLMSRAEDRSAQAEETEKAAEVSKQAEASGVPGIYVYTLPHYLRYPYDPVSGRTLLKVGHSAVDAHYRAASQGRLTALPEDPILLRIYPVDSSAEAERQFHAWLRDADHHGARTRRGGSEWFVTSTKFLDRIAKSLNLDVHVVNDFEAGDE